MLDRAHTGYGGDDSPLTNKNEDGPTDPLADNLPVNSLPREYGPHIRQLQGFGSWVKGLKVFVKENLIVAWKKENQSESIEDNHTQRMTKIKQTNHQIIFYALDNQHPYQQGEVWSRYYDPMIKDDFITDILIFKEQKFFITAHHLGDIHLRKLVELKKESND